MARCTPIISCDLNDALIAYDKFDNAVGPMSWGGERTAGNDYHSFLTKHDLAALNTFTTSDATYHGDKHTSYIDFVSMPNELAKSSKCHINHKASPLLQAIKSRKFKDH